MQLYSANGKDNTMEEHKYWSYKDLSVVEDEGILIVNKPSGLLSIPDRNNEKASVLSILRKKHPNVFTIHRLDFETSGIMIFASTEEVHRALNIQFEHRQVEKIYHAIVQGNMLKTEGTIDLKIDEDKANKGKMKITRDGKPALSLYQVIENFKHFAYVAINLKTGRTHQARLHMKAIGHPMAVDKDYGFHEEFLLSSIKRKYKEAKWSNERPLVSRCTLHAYSLKVMHPIHKKEVTYTAELKKDMAVMLKYLREFDASN